jgi:NosR/NirI family nitrous oxide reductase transcriptional regulator
LEIVGDILSWIIAIGLVLAGVLVILIWVRDKTRRVSYLRIFIGMVSVVAVYYLFTLTVWLLLVLVIIVVVTLFFGRFFCGWTCPFGLYMDLITLVRKSFKMGYWNLPEKLNRSLHKLRYPIMIIFLILPFFTGPSYFLIWQMALFLVGPFKPLNILLGPLEPLIVPWSGGPVGFSGWSASFPYVREIIDYTSGTFFVLASVFVFVAFTVVSSFAVRRFWCRFCPTGVSIAIVNRFAPFKWAPVLRINKVEEKCTKCGICKRVCPLQVTEVYEEKGGDITTSMCTLCFRCVEMCPYEDTLKVKVAGKTVFKSRDWLEPSKSN